MENATPAERLARWYQERGRALRAGDTPPADREEAVIQAAEIRKKMRVADGGTRWPRKPARLDPHVVGTLDRDGYRIEKLIFQTWPGCYATATVYVPTAGKAPHPAVLNVHGHWEGARRDPVLQSRCIGLAKLGFVALTLDAWGAGERGTVAGQNEYHGGLLGASLWPVGTPLHGMQLYENVRALDYLQSRGDVDSQRIGCTGASGGGNQTTHISAFDERIRCAVPVCSVGQYADYLDTACCVDEVMFGALTFAEEGDLLGMLAPRPLMVISASRDTYHFAPESAGKALDRARPVFRVYNAGDRIKHVVFDSGHDYSRPMREAMYGWMRRWLKNEGDGSPTPEPEHQTDDPEVLRCFAPAERPSKVMTTVTWVRARAQKLADAQKLPANAAAWPAERSRRLKRLSAVLDTNRDRLMGADRPEPSRNFERGAAAPLMGKLSSLGPHDAARPPVVLLHPGGSEAAQQTPLAQALRAAGFETRAPDLPGCGALTAPNQGGVREIPDHNLVEWSNWLGWPLLGQWLLAISFHTGTGRSEDAPLHLVGWREAGLAALLAASRNENVHGVAAIECPASFVTDTPPHNSRMAIFAPRLMELGDIPQLAGLAAPRPVLIANPLRLDGSPVPADEMEKLYRWPRDLYRTVGKPSAFEARAGTADAEIIEAVKRW